MDAKTQEPRQRLICIDNVGAKELRVGEKYEPQAVIMGGLQFKTPMVMVCDRWFQARRFMRVVERG